MPGRKFWIMTSARRIKSIDAFTILRVLQISGKAFFVSVDGMEKRAVAFEFDMRDIESAAKIADARALDFHNARAEVREPQSGRRTSKKLAEIQYEESFERFHCFPIIRA